jgi:hypothetical protein
VGEVRGVMPDGITRRDALRKGAVAGGAIVWAVPLVQSMGLPSAFGQSAGTPRCDCTVRIVTPGGDCLADNCQLTPEACECFQTQCNCTTPCRCAFNIVPNSCSPC